MDKLQKIVDGFYQSHGKCCAGCDWWRYHKSTVIGDCTKTAPASAQDRADMLDIEGFSGKVSAGHIITPRDHVCGDFRDTTHIN